MKLFKGSGLSVRHLALVGGRTLASAAASGSIIGIFLVNAGWPLLEKRLKPSKKGKKRKVRMAQTGRKTAQAKTRGE